MRILVADDDIDVNGLYKTALESSGHQVTLTTDGSECIVRYRTAQFEIVILDYKMPSADGVQVAKEILSKNPNQRIILASSIPEESILNLKQLGRDIQTLPKPFEPEELVAAVEGMMTKK